MLAAAGKENFTIWIQLAEMNAIKSTKFIILILDAEPYNTLHFNNPLTRFSNLAAVRQCIQFHLEQNQILRVQYLHNAYGQPQPSTKRGDLPCQKENNSALANQTSSM